MVYISYVTYNMYGVMNPMRNVVIEPGTPTIQPLWSEGTKVSMNGGRPQVITLDGLAVAAC